MDGRKDRQRGRRARLARKDGKADTLLACLSVSHSRSVWRTRGSGFVPSPAAPGAGSESGLHPGTSLPDPQPTCAGRAPILNRESVCPRPPRRAKFGSSEREAGRAHRAPRTLGPLRPGPQRSRYRRAALTFLKSHGPKSKRSHSGSSRIFPGGRAGHAGRVPGKREPGLRSRARGGCRSGGSGRRGPRTERREERKAALGAGRGRGRKLGLTRAGWGAGLRGAPIPAAPRAPPPAQLGAPKVTFTPTRPRHAPGPGAKWRGLRDSGTLYPRGRVCAPLRNRAGSGARGSGTLFPKQGTVEQGPGEAQRPSKTRVPRSSGPLRCSGPWRVPGQKQGRGRGEGGLGPGRLPPRGADGDGWAPRGSFGPEMRIIDHRRKPHHFCQ